MAAGAVVRTTVIAAAMTGDPLCGAARGMVSSGMISSEDIPSEDTVAVAGEDETMDARVGILQ